MGLKQFAAAALLLAGAAWADELPMPADYRPPFHPEGEPLEGLTITIDAGHGGSSFSQGYHGSALGVNSRLVEGDLNMRVAGLVYYHLREAGATVHMTRRDDRKVTLGATDRAAELGARPAMAEATRSHLFLSLHHNSAPRKTADGVVVLIWPTDKAGADQPLEREFAEILRTEVEKKVHHAEPFTHYVNQHPLVADSDLPSVVVEFGFLSNAEFDAWVSNPTAHKDEAVALYDAIVRMWTDHRAELESERDKVLGPAPAAEPKASDITETFPFGRPPKNVWPFDRRIADAGEAAWFVNTWKRQSLSDSTVFWTTADFDFGRDGDKLVVNKAEVVANHAVVGKALARDLRKALGVDIEPTVKLLPSEALGEERFGVVHIPMALMWGEPKEHTLAMTQVLLGEPLFLLDVTPAKDWYLVQGVDAYCGWLRADAVMPLDREAFATYMDTPSARTTRGAMAGTFRVPPASRVPFFEEDGQVRLTPLRPPQVAEGSVFTPRQRAEDLITVAPESVRLPSAVSPGRFAAETALREYLYVPYVFSGRSNLGLDCSGLVGACWATAGVQLPRDAYQQALMGRIVATPWFREALEPGDALFFMDENGRISHTGLSMGGLKFVHCSPPEVQITSMDPNDPLYSEHWTNSFAIARRPAE